MLIVFFGKFIKGERIDLYILIIVISVVYFVCKEFFVFYWRKSVFLTILEIFINIQKWTVWTEYNRWNLLLLSEFLEFVWFFYFLQISKESTKSHSWARSNQKAISDQR